MNNFHKYAKLFARCFDHTKIEVGCARLFSKRRFTLLHSLKNAEGTNASLQNQKRSPTSRYFKVLGLAGFGAFTTIGLYGYVKMRSLRNSNLEDYMLKEAPPSCRIARTVQSSADNSGLKFTLYQYQTCPFCCKVRAYLDYYGFSYNIVEVNSVTQAQTKWSSYKKVPFLLVEDEASGTIIQLKDSTLIISILQSVLTNHEMSIEAGVQSYPVAEYENKENLSKPKKMYMNRYFLMNYVLPKNRSKEDMLLERQWRRWVDDVYVHMLSPNVYRTLKEAHQAFSWFSEVGRWEELFSNWERLLVIFSGTLVMYLIGKKLKRKHNLKDDVRQSLYDESELWMNVISKAGGPFIGGSEPNLADLAMYGVLTAIEGCDAFRDLLENTGIEIWFANMRNVVHSHSGSETLSGRGKISLS